ncbi:DUF2946 family protein [Gemmobacter serpentinus]|uniref:DUF2946 family protein n=1 Tax=Gemmobacter serpentinus TaxID=2652247 RepID=UPI00124DEBBC|nr:DUF2946 family protein [Gemmobacter serpentinus]
MKSTLRHIGITLVMILAVSMAGLGYAHKVPSAQEQAQQQAMAVFAMAGVTMADFCGDNNGDGLPDEHCPACRLVDATLLPPQIVALRDADQRLVATITAPMENLRVQPVFDPARASRGPPLA